MVRCPVSNELRRKLHPLIPASLLLSKALCTTFVVTDEATLNVILFVLQKGMPCEDLPNLFGMAAVWLAGDVYATGMPLAYEISCNRRCWIACVNVIRPIGAGPALTNPRHQACGAWNGVQSHGQRARLGSKRHIVVNARGMPLVILVSGPHRHGFKMLEKCAEAIPATAGLAGYHHNCLLYTSPSPRD